MNNCDEKSTVLVWRLVTVIIGLVWIISFLVRIFVLSDGSLEQGLMSRNVYIGFCVLTALMLIALMIVPFQFYIHAAFCWLWSMARLIDGGVTNALLIHFLSYIFLYRQGVFQYPPPDKTDHRGMPFGRRNRVADTVWVYNTVAATD